MMDKQDIKAIIRTALSKVTIGGRSYIIAANWKMNKRKDEAEALAKAIANLKLDDRNTVVIIPPYPYLHIMQDTFRYSKVLYGAQNVCTEEKGAYTGEVAADMIADYGCKYVVVGHSERREYYGETDSIVNTKAKICLKHGLIPIICVGEKLEARKDGSYKTILKTQLENALLGVTPAEAAKVVIAYEPVWAIGTGVVATAEEVEETHGYIRGILEAILGAAGSDVPILYGGSVKSSNVGETALASNVSGFLIGGASLDIKEFSAIINNLGGLAD